MNFLMKCYDGDEIATENFDFKLAIVGKAIDDRGKIARDFAEKHCSKVIEVEYVPYEMQMLVRGQIFEVEDFILWLKAEFAEKSGTILVEATTLDFTEIFFSIYTFVDEPGIKLEFLYIEPEKYKQLSSESDAEATIRQIKSRGFDLSEQLGDFIGIPLALINLSSASYIDKGVFFLGYEAHRFERIFEEHDGNLPVKRKPVIFGVPPFQAGMELHSFAANVSVLETRGIHDGVYYCAANNPLAAYEALQEHYSSLTTGQKMFVAPLGTKPEAIGIAAFVAEKSFYRSNPSIGVIYDHPRKKDGRSSSVFKWHLYEAV